MNCQTHKLYTYIPFSFLFLAIPEGKFYQGPVLGLFFTLKDEFIDQREASAGQFVLFYILD